MTALWNTGMNTGRYVLRCLLVDLEPGCLDTVRASKYGGLFRPGE